MSDFLRGNVPQFMERWMRAFQVKGPIPDAFDAATQLTVKLADLTTPEYLWLGRTARFISGRTVAATAGNHSIHELVNPAGSGILVVAQATIMNPAAAVTNFFFNDGPFTPTAGLTLNTAVLNADTRQGQNGIGVGLPIAQVFSGAPGVIAGFGWFMGIGAAQRVVLPPVVLVPGMLARVHPQGTNTGADVQWEWTERPLNTEEV